MAKLKMQQHIAKYFVYIFCAYHATRKYLRPIIDLTSIIILHVCLSVPLFLGNHLRNHNKAQRTEQDRSCRMHNYAWFKIIMPKNEFSLFCTYVWLRIYGSTSSRVCKVWGMIPILLCIELSHFSNFQRVHTTSYFIILSLSFS